MNRCRPPAMIDNPRCYLCGGEGTIRHDAVEDGLFGVQGRWRLRGCPRCGLWWLDPIPAPEAISLLYDSYFTHEEETEPRLHAFVREGIFAARHGDRRTVLGTVLSRIGPLRELFDVEHMGLGPGPGRVLDVGCGNGRFLTRARALGWEPFGVDPDERGAAAATRRVGANVFHGTVESATFEPSSFDAITLNHVIEHLLDPVATLQRCAELLSPTGRIVITTPNLDSWGHRRFGACWLGLDPPRHVHLFSQHSLKLCIERAGLSVGERTTPARWAYWIWQTSSLLERRGALPGGDLSDASRRLKVQALFFWMAEYLASWVKPVGEELLLIARRPGAVEGA